MPEIPCNQTGCTFKTGDVDAAVGAAFIAHHLASAHPAGGGTGPAGSAAAMLVSSGKTLKLSGYPTERALQLDTVSYTHLTLPTILLV